MFECVAKPCAYACYRVHCFVNGIDLVPRILGKQLDLTSEDGLLADLVSALPGPVSKFIHREACIARAFEPFGSFHFLGEGMLHESCDSRLQPALVEAGLRKVNLSFWERLKRGKQMLSHHGLGAYKTGIADCLSEAALAVMPEGQLAEGYDYQLISAGDGDA